MICIYKYIFCKSICIYVKMLYKIIAKLQMQKIYYIANIYIYICKKCYIKSLLNFKCKKYNKYIYNYWRKDFRLVPIVVGQIDNKMQNELGKILRPFFEQQDCLFVISSDFCHWGIRFDYQYFDDEHDEIFECISNLDRMAMNAISTMEN